MGTVSLFIRIRWHTTSHEITFVPLNYMHMIYINEGIVVFSFENMLSKYPQFSFALVTPRAAFGPFRVLRPRSSYKDITPFLVTKLS
jgi:hypothetical protein